MSATRHHVLIVDDHPLFVDALQLALTPLVSNLIVSKSASLGEACTHLTDEAPDLILLDLSLPDAGGADAVARIRELAPQVRLVVVSGRDDPVTIGLSKALGCDGFISKALPLTDIQVLLRKAISGRDVFPVGPPSAFADAVAALTPAQARVLAAAATGKLNKQIAHEMRLAEPTVKSHMSAILKRLGVSNRTQAILAITGRA
jgi:DNA-binding NarL/FixJ family response regulator